MKRTTTIQDGLFLTFEGPEGSGKTTQIERLQRALEALGRDVLVTREPGGTALGERLRELIMHFHDPEGVCPEAELLMFGASRAQHVQRVILPQLARGGVVICDRFADSTTVYQGMVRELDPAFIRSMHDLTVCGRWPDITLLLDIDVRIGLERARGRHGAQRDRLEEEPFAFHEAVRQGFLSLAEQERKRIRIIDASQSEDAVHQRIMEELQHALG